MTDNDDAGKQASERLEAELQKRNISYIPYSKYIEYLGHYEAIRYMKDSNEMLQNAGTDFAKLVKELYNEAEKVTLAEYDKETADTYFTEFLERITSTTYRPLPIQFTKLNNALGGGFLRQSIISIGGGTSTGKTTFCLQLVDDFLKDHKVIYYSLEMSKDNILAKLLSYVGYRTPFNDAKISHHYYEAGEILQGYKWDNDRKEEIAGLMEAYKDRAKNLIVMKPQKPTIDTILDEAEKVRRITGEAPILFIDYLQLLQGTPKQDAQAVIKEATQKLKDYVIKNDTLVFTIIAYNRDSTKGHGKATIESGRDTSDIEYSSDYILSINYEEYEKGNSDKDLEELKHEEARKMTIKVLKNRLGTTGDKINYDFIAKYNTYIEKEYFKRDTQPQQSYNKSNLI